VHNFWLLVEGEAAVGFVSIPQPQRLPDAIFVDTLLGGNDLGTNPGELSG
jgi:hypothetical protein